MSLIGWDPRERSLQGDTSPGEPRLGWLWIGIFHHLAQLTKSSSNPWLARLPIHATRPSFHSKTLCNILITGAPHLIPILMKLELSIQLPMYPARKLFWLMRGRHSRNPLGGPLATTHPVDFATSVVQMLNRGLISYNKKMENPIKWTIGATG